MSKKPSLKNPLLNTLLNRNKGNMESLIDAAENLESKVTGLSLSDKQPLSSEEIKNKSIEEVKEPVSDANEQEEQEVVEKQINDNYTNPSLSKMLENKSLKGEVLVTQSISQKNNKRLKLIADAGDTTIVALLNNIVDDFFERYESELNKLKKNYMKNM
ncbi:MAG: hypothetical protein ACK4K9_10075 [Bacteroidia bacterium]